MKRKNSGRVEMINGLHDTVKFEFNVSIFKNGGRTKLKILSVVCLALIIIFTEAMPTFALTSENKAFPYYTNLNHIELTEDQYKNLARVSDEDTIATFTQDMVDILANDTTLETRGHSKYI
ncbi:hypothetical protein I6G82_19475 [Lysinibacillus macroides]|nr:hypothetical protein [Lysinibacillus macroides]QPR67371.1 hypothetical protein I6G82_19475 [Lysinibacillus macroides]